MRVDKVILKETSEIEIHLKLPTYTFNTETPENVDSMGLFFGDKRIADDSDSKPLGDNQQAIFYKDMLNFIRTHEHYELVLKVKCAI